ncbi:hypothetical protein [Sediminibacterium soli]|uniref:hypothetical protein n=1 Tax=Sediminibacterium soli TaxID=2698829 RepID=UPI00137A7FB7|nr:hypothetical protein [Sediminibacterium soli]NCI47035.1 hypothetical protein [Sediminibacterium soli]
MKSFDINTLQEGIQQIRTTTVQLIDEGYNRIASYILYPQSFAGFTGLKKLIEKDYSESEPQEQLAGSLVSS